MDKLLPEGYYTHGDDDIFDNFCDRYPFLVRMISFGNEFLVIYDNEMLERYFRIGLPKEIINVFEKSASILKGIEDQEKIEDLNYDENNIKEIKKAIQENKAVNAYGKTFRMVESTGSVKVKVKKSSMVKYAKSLLK